MQDHSNFLVNDCSLKLSPLQRLIDTAGASFDLEGLVSRGRAIGRNPLDIE